MFLTYSSKNTISLQRSYNKVLQLSTAFDQSFVILAVDIPGESQIVAHIDKFGKELFVYKSSCTLGQMIMLEDKTVIVAEKEQNAIKRLDLLNRSVHHIPYLFTSSMSASFQLFYFTETSLLALLEYSNFKEHYIVVSYFNAAGMEIIFHQTFYFDKDEKAKLIFKSNDKSMIVWCSAIQLSTLSLSICELNHQNYQASLRNIQIALPELSIQNKNQYPSISILSIRQKDNYSLSIYCNSMVSINQNDQQILVNHQIVLNLISLQPLVNTMVLDGQQQLIVTQIYFIGKAAIYQTVQLSQQETFSKTTRYYVDSLKQITFYSQPYQYTNKHHVCFNDHKKQMVQWIWHQDNEVYTVEIEYIKVIDIKDLTMHLLLHLNDDFDDDLLYDIINLLDIE